jgi:hypothetical protein
LPWPDQSEATLSVLAYPLQLGAPERGGVIEDVEALVNKVISDRLRKWPRGRNTLNEHQRDDLVSYLVAEAWHLERRYDPKKDKSPNFPAYVAHILNLRIVDWFRQAFTDTRHGEKPVVLSLDAPAKLDGGGASAGEAADAGADRLVDTLAASTGDPAEDRSPDLVGILNGGNRGGARTHAAVGEPKTRGASRRNRGAAKPKRVMPRNATPMPRRSAKPPVCENCFDAFLAAFLKVNRKTAAEDQLTKDELVAKAAKRAQAVRFGSEWACPRCTKLKTPEGTELMLQQAYPNRATRRAAVGGANSRKTKPKQQSARQRHPRKSLYA